MNDFHILLFETSSTLCGVALISQIAGKKSITQAHHNGSSQHAEHMLPMANDLLAEQKITPHDLTAVAFGRGPGGFTGLRVACSVAQGIATGLGIPVISVDTMLAIIMQNANQAEPGIHLILQDARMNEVYAAAYRATGSDWLVLQAPILLARADISTWLDLNIPLWDMQSSSTWQVHGNAVHEFAGLADEILLAGGLLAGDQAELNLISAMAEIANNSYLAGELISAADAMPLYVRDKVAFTTAERAMGQGGNPQAKNILAPTLHKIKASDVPEIAAIERQVQEFPWTLQNFISGLGSGYHGWLARSMGAMAGFALLMDVPDAVHLLVLGVHPSSQRQGIGYLLLQQCIAHCKQTNKNSLTLEVRKSNRQAINFYLKNGFQQQGVRTDYYPTANGREDGLIMTLTIS